MDNIESTTSLELAHTFLGKNVTITIDRPLGSHHPKHGFVYPLNYGFVEGIFAPDGEELDAYVLGIDHAVESAEGVCIAIAHRKDNDDDKLIVAPKGQPYTDEEIIALIHFQEQWFDTVIVR
jgi:inorganic pyrophosphatase